MVDNNAKASFRGKRKWAAANYDINCSIPKSYNHFKILFFFFFQSMFRVYVSVVEDDEHEH